MISYAISLWPQRKFSGLMRPLPLHPIGDIKEDYFLRYTTNSTTTLLMENEEIAIFMAMSYVRGKMRYTPVFPFRTRYNPMFIGVLIRVLH